MHAITTLLIGALLAPVAAIAGESPERSKDPLRPTGPVVGVGLGVHAHPVLTVASVRVRFDDHFALEPIVGFGYGVVRSEETGTGEVVTTTFATYAGANLRYGYPISRRTDLVAIAGLGADIMDSNVDPKGADNDTNWDAVRLSANWGAGFDTWLTRRWSVGLEATNPLLAYTRSTSVDEASGSEITERNATFAEQLHPTLRVMAHVYF